MRESLRHWMATVGKLALSAGLMWMGVDLAHAHSIPVAAAHTPSQTVHLHPANPIAHPLHRAC